MSFPNRIIILISIIILINMPLKVAKGESTQSVTDVTKEDVEKALEDYGISGYDSKIISDIGHIKGLDGLSYTDIVYNALTGELDLPEAVSMLIKTAFSEIIINGAIMRSIIVISILGAVLKALDINFSESSISEIGYYVIYIALVSLMIMSFVTASQTASEAISNMTTFMRILIPLIMALLVASGRYAISFVFHPSAMLVTEIAAHIIDKVILSIIIITAAIQMVNFLMKAGALDNMTELAYDIISNGFKWFAIAFMAMLSIEAAAAPLAGGVVGKSARSIISAVPVVGGAFAGAVDSVFFWGSAIKNASAIAAIICVTFICLIPVTKLMAIAFLYKLTSALLEPFADDRVVSLINASGKYIMLFAMAVMCVCVMLVTLLMMVIAGAMG